LYLTLPPSPDQFNHAYLGWRLLAGDIPYVDFVDMNWPGVMGLHALAEVLFGFNVWSWRAFDFLMFAISALCLVDIVRQGAGRDAAKLTLLLAPLVYASVGFGVAGQHDMSAGQFLIGAAWFHIRGHSRDAAGWQLATGLFLGIAMLNKPTVAVLWPLLVLQVLWLRQPMRRVVVHSVLAGVATLLTVFAAFAAVIGIGTPVADLVDAVYGYNVATQFLKSVTLAQAMFDALTSVTWLVSTLVSLLAFGWLLKRDHRSIAGTAVPLLWLAGVLSYLAQTRGHLYHLGPSFLALTAGQSITLVLMSSGRLRIGPSVQRGSVLAVLSLVVLVGVGNRIFDVYGQLPMALIRADLEQYFDGFKGGDGISASDAARFVRQLRDDPRPGCVLVVGEVSSINYLTQRPQPSRFYYFPVIFNMNPPLPMAQRWNDLWERDLRAADCPVALVSPKASASWLAGPTPAAAALRDFLGKYHKAGMLGGSDGMTIYHKN
jgi:4-amino-4-deoxy-L-arabinose transferase-like glycosyltransferase